jgi:hypothetical protein
MEIVVRNDQLVGLLKNEVEECYGKKVSTYGNCLELSEEIFAKTSFQVNPNTLRRVFGLVKTKYLPSFATLNILSKYCGFTSIGHFKTTLQAEKLNEGICEQHILNFLTDIFRKTAVIGPNDQTFLDLCQHTIGLISLYPCLAGKFNKIIAKTKNGQEYYFEQCVNIDHLNSFYGDGIRYYLTEKKTTEGQIFGNSLLCLKAWLTKNDEMLMRRFKVLENLRLPKSVHPFVCGRYFASKLYFVNATGSNPERILLDAHQVHETIKQANDNYKLFPCFEYIIGGALVVTRLYGEAIYYLNYALKNYPGRHSYLDAGFYESLLLFKALALAKTKQQKEAGVIYHQLKPSRFYFLTKKINTILYLILEKELGRSGSSSEKKLAELIQETGFVKFLEL